MGMIREYMAQAGDPRGHGLRKAFHRIGRLARRAVPIASMLPIPGAQILGSFAGDPGPPTKRKSAGAGPKQKAANKRKGRGQPPKRHKAGQRGKIDIGGIVQQHLGEAIRGTADVAKAFIQGGPTAAAGEMIDQEGMPEIPDVAGASVAIHPTAGPMLVPHGVKHRMPTLVHRRVDSWVRRAGRSMNPANVKALRRGIRRVEGFERLHKSVLKAFPALRPRHACSCGGTARRGKR